MPKFDKKKEDFWGPVLGGFGGMESGLNLLILRHVVKAQLEYLDTLGIISNCRVRVAGVVQHFLWLP